MYANPFAHQKQKIDFYATDYAYPYFQQNWNLFVPAPRCNYKLFAEAAGSRLVKTDVFAEIVTHHQANRFAGYGPLVVAFSNSIHYFEKSTALQKPLNGPIADDSYFSMLVHATKNYLEADKKIIIRDLKLTLVVDEIETNYRRIYYN